MTSRSEMLTERDRGAGTRDSFIIIRNDREGNWLSTRTVSRRTYSDCEREQVAAFGEGYSGRVHKVDSTREGDVRTWVTLIDPATRNA